MMRTTIVADESLMIELKKTARRQGRSVSDILREAARQYVARERGGPLSFVGTVESGHTDTGRRAEELLAESMGQSDE